MYQPGPGLQLGLCIRELVQPQHRTSGIQFFTPNLRHNGQTKAIC